MEMPEVKQKWWQKVISAWPFWIMVIAGAEIVEDIILVFR